jgi:predicted ribonuclease YlaK
MKGDNLILSVAVRYRKHRPVLVTNDKNLALKAKAEEIASMSVDDFDKRSRQSVRPEAGGVEKKPSQRPTGRPPRPRRRP